MGQKLPPDEMNLYRHVDEVLYYLWDPVFAKTSPRARDEYYSYVPGVFGMLKETTDGRDIREWLAGCETNMFVRKPDSSMEKIDQIVEILLEYRTIDLGH